jgi:hypothetical protein
MADDAVADAVAAVEAAATKNGQRGRRALRTNRPNGVSRTMRSMIAPMRAPRKARASNIAVKPKATKGGARPIAVMNRAAKKMIRVRVGLVGGGAGDAAVAAKAAVKDRAKAVATSDRERRDPKRATSRRPRESRTMI